MFGPGFVWIVKDVELGNMKLLCTYLAGSPFPGAHYRAQQMDMATQATGMRSFMNPGEPVNYAGSFGRHSRAGQDLQRPIGHYNANPVLCVNTWEHAYLRDYGVGGKRAYLQSWWERIDWAVVEENAKRVERRDFGRTVSKAFSRYGELRGARYF
jgi:superoxide dismutase, Fe-Mn family